MIQTNLQRPMQKSRLSKLGTPVHGWTPSTHKTKISISTYSSTVRQCVSQLQYHISVLRSLFKYITKTHQNNTTHFLSDVSFFLFGLEIQAKTCCRHVNCSHSCLLQSSKTPQISICDTLIERTYGFLQRVGMAERGSWIVSTSAVAAAILASKAANFAALSPWTCQDKLHQT